LQLLFFPLFRQVVAHCTARGRADDGMMASHVPRHGTDSCALEASFALGGTRPGQQCNTCQRQRKPLKR
jgi:hypothetical protein